MLTIRPKACDRCGTERAANKNFAHVTQHVIAHAFRTGALTSPFTICNPPSACMARPNKAVKMHTSIMTQKMAGVDVLTTDGELRCCRDRASSRRWRWRSLPRQTAPARFRRNPPQFCQNPPCSGWRFPIAVPRCGRLKIPSTTTTIAVGTEIRKASPPVCFGPSKFSKPILRWRRRRTFPDVAHPRYWNADKALIAAVTR